MKVLFITDNFPPEFNAPATRTFEHCNEWIKLGAKVTILTCAPNFPQGKVYKGYKNKIFQFEKLQGIRVIRVWSYITANEKFLKRILDYLSFSLSSFIAGLFIKSDIIIATSPQFFTTISAFSLSVLKRKPWIFELRDLWPDSIMAVNAMKYGIVIKCLNYLELFLYKKATMVIPLTMAFKENLINRGIDENKIKVITNGSNLELFSPRLKNLKILDDLKLNGKFIIGYIGTHGMAHGLDFIVNTISKIDDTDMHFLFIGDGAKKREIEDLAKKMKIKNITFLDPICKDDVPGYLSIVDISLIPLKKSDIFKTVIPSKIFESSAMKKPMLLGVEGQAKDIIEDYNAGICFEPENESDLIEKLKLLKYNKNLYEDLQDGCTRLAADYNRIKLARQMYQYISNNISNEKKRITYTN